MDIQYYKDAKHNYLILDTQIDEENMFQYKMLENNSIEGLLPFTLRNIDECNYLYYEIDKRQSLKNRYDRKKMSHEKMLQLFEDLIKTVKNLGEYLLDPCHIILSPEGIFEELSSGKFYFIYDPAHEIQDEQIFMDTIMEYADTEDEKASKLVDKVMDSMICGSGTDFTILESLLADERKEGSREQFVIDEMSPKIDTFQNYDEYEVEDDEPSEEEAAPEKKIKIKLPADRHFLMAMLFAVVSGALVYLRYAYVLTYEENMLDIAVFMVSTLMSFTCVIIHLKENRKIFSKDNNAKDGVDEITDRQRPMNPIPDMKTFKEVKDESGSLIRNRDHSLEDDMIRRKDQLFDGDMIRRRDHIFEDDMIRHRDHAFENDEDEETVLLSLDFAGRSHKLYAKEGSADSNIDLENLPLVIGKLPACSDIIINDKSVSRMHAKIFRPGNGEDGLWVQDLNSTNGTYINGKRLMPNEEAPLKEEDEISFGKCVYAFR